jgi:2-amino-4-hydroxy-6-hydroxymethyldihydropteridine diphosphokinase
MSVAAFVALGSNLGDRAAFLAAARDGLAMVEGVRVVRATDVEETAPLGGLAQPAYLNQMVQLETTLEARALLSACHELEREAGRARHVHWDSRTLDVDLVRYGTLLCDRPDLRLPHPGLRDRPFWQRELAALESHG